MDNAACAVFVGKVVVSGGDDHGEELNIVQAYDHVADKWSIMPNMIEKRQNHKSIAIKNKLFIVGGNSKSTCEVFDLTCNKFVLLKPHFKSVEENFDYLAEVISIGSKLVVFGTIIQTIWFYDVEKNEWSEAPFQLTGLLFGFGCAKFPQF